MKTLLLLPLLLLAGPRPERPNVLFVFADDQRPDTIGALGNDVIRTPRLDALARSALAFENAYCMGSTVGAVCNPSRHMMLSGMSLYRYDRNRKEGTFGDVFRKAGYETWHLSKKGNTARVYHQATDTLATLDPAFASDVTRAIVGQAATRAVFLPEPDGAAQLLAGVALLWILRRARGSRSSVGERRRV